MDNNFDNNNGNKEQTPFDGYSVYSKQYTPSDNGYRENKTYRDAGDRRGERKRSSVIVALSLAFALVFSGCAFFAASFAISRYDALYLEYEEYRNREELNLRETEQVPVTDAVEDTADAETSENLFFSSDEDTDVKLSDSPAVTVGGSVGDPNLTMADVAALVSASVVEITTSETYLNGLAYQSGAGSGVIVNESGMIITNNHVIEGASNVSVRLTNGSVYNAKIVATDVETDIAILKIEPNEELTVAVRGDSERVVVGEEVLAIGNPLGMLGGTVTNGIISAREREVTIDGESMVLLQHNAAISPGNSGGALFNMRGELIGIVNAKYSSSNAEGLGFAIPMNTVMKVYDDLCNYGYVKGRADHGITIVTDRYYFFQGYLYVYSSRYTDELQYGDRIVSIEGKIPETVEEAYSILDEFEIGDRVEIVVSRNNKKITVMLGIREYEPQ